LGRAVNDAAMSASVTRTLAERIAALRFEQLPPDVVALGKALVLDTLGTTIAATRLGAACTEVADVMWRLGGPPESTIVGRPGKVAAPHAAFANGALAHALNYDAVGSETGHTGVACFAAPLAVAEAVAPVPGTRFITAVIAAAEVTARLSRAATRSTAGVSPRLLAGQYFSYAGAAAGAALLLGLDARGLHNALGLALMQTAGARQVVIAGDPPAKAIYGAFPAQAGVIAARLAEAGVEAGIDAVAGEAGWLKLAGAEDADTSALLDGFGTVWRCLQVDFKPWPVSNHVMPFIEAALLLRDDVRDDDLATVELVGEPAIRPWFEPLDERRAPSNAASAANSVFFAVAKVIANGKLGLADFTEAGLHDAAIARLTPRMTYRLDESVRGGTVRLTTTDGHVRSKTVADPLGSSVRPLSQAQLTAKFADCCRAAGVERSRIDAAVARIASLEGSSGVTDLATVAAPAQARGA
jgi:2-methylcitrate dehydratase PrpD